MINLRKLDTAQSLIKQTSKKFPKAAWLNKWSAEIAKTNKAYQQAIKINPEDNTYTYALSWLYSYQIGNLYEAIKQRND